MKIDLNTLTFGFPAAERDPDLHACFVFSETYKRLEKREKTIILGNRGSGKSALFKQLAENERRKGTVVIQLAPEDYAYELLAQVLRSEAQGSWQKHGAYAAAWKHLIYITVMKHLINQGCRFKKGAEARLYAYLRDNYEGTETNPIGMMVSFMKRLELLKVKVDGYETDIRVRKLKRLYTLEDLEPFLADIRDVCRAKRVIVLVDELDKGWDASEDAIAFVSGLFHAATSINATETNMSIYVSLRKELYDNIPALYDDAQKVRDIIEYIEWDELGLLELIGRRIARKVPELEKVSFGNRWNVIFSETLDYRRTNSFNYVVDRTLYRPREIIQFCNDISDKVRKSEVKDFSPFNYHQIAEAEHGYSESRLKDIASEYRFQYPGLQSILETFRGMTYSMERDQLIDHLIKILLGEIPIDADAMGWCESFDQDKLIMVLWQVGFLRALAVGGLKARRRSGSEYLGIHQISSLNLAAIPRFHIHPMFRAFLGMKEPKT
ncbi:MAG: hypothetical protein MUO31_09900 [Thermodesulfovibrionales bacterium]|nr:hypothetical protein [Thermodesulfovibrionales bacterium]